MESLKLASDWYDMFNESAGDLYPGRYTREFCLELAETALCIKELAARKNSTILVHNYQYPEMHEIGDFIGDSLGLVLNARACNAQRVDFASVFFMGATTKIMLGDATRVYVQDRPDVLGCSLVSGTSHRWIENWKRRNPSGVLVTYINSDAYTKALSDYVSTSRNTAEVILRASIDHPDSQILVLPDKYLGLVMKSRAVALGVDPKRVEIYDYPFGGNNACCYVHEKIGDDAPEKALEEHPDAELMIHPECGCASSCLYKLQAGILPQGRVYYLSTEQMLGQAKRSDKKEFVVATEKGMLYRLRRMLPEKKFYPVSDSAECKFMKENNLKKLYASLLEDKYEIVFDENADPKKEFVLGNKIQINLDIAEKAKAGIERMMQIF